MPMCWVVGTCSAGKKSIYAAQEALPQSPQFSFLVADGLVWFGEDVTVRDFPKGKKYTHNAIEERNSG